MNGYVLTVMGTVLLSAILTILVPEGKTSGIIKGVTKLACLIVIISPIPQFLKNERFFDVIRGESVENNEAFFEENGITTDKSFIQYYCKWRVEETQTALENELSEKFAVKVAVTIVWKFDNAVDVNGIKITKIKIKTQGDVNQEMKSKITEYVRKTYCSEVQIE